MTNVPDLSQHGKSVKMHLQLMLEYATSRIAEYSDKVSKWQTVIHELDAGGVAIATVMRDAIDKFITPQGMDMSEVGRLYGLVFTALTAYHDLRVGSRQESRKVPTNPNDPNYPYYPDDPGHKM